VNVSTCALARFRGAERDQRQGRRVVSLPRRSFLFTASADRFYLHGPLREPQVSPLGVLSFSGRRTGTAAVSSRYRYFDQACPFCVGAPSQCLRPSCALPLVPHSLGRWRSERKRLLDYPFEAFCPVRLRGGRSQGNRAPWRLLECALISPPEITHPWQVGQELAASIDWASPCNPLEFRDDACSCC
jgi:hypothetical protein